MFTDRVRNGPSWRCRKTASDEAGLTLVELLVVMMLMMVVMGAIYGIWAGLARSYTFAEDDIRAQDEARMALNEVIEYVRTAREPDASLIPPGSEYLEALMPKAGPYEIWVWTDLDRDPSHDLELVKFALEEDASTGLYFLTRETSPAGNGNFPGTGVRIINQNIRNKDNSLPVFEYFDGNGLELAPDADDVGEFIAQPNEVQEVEIDLHVDIDPSRSPIAHEISSVVQPRNLRKY